MTLIVGSPKAQFFKSNGEFASGYLVYSSLSGASFATNPVNTYPTVADALAGTNANPNPITLDSRGEAFIVAKGATRLVLATDAGVTIYTMDGIDSSSGDVLDANGNYLLKFTTTASAVNYVGITNATTGNRPKIEFTGSDTDVGGNITSKGSGALYVDAGDAGDLELNNTSSGTVRARKALVAHSTLTSTGAFTASSTSTFTGAATFNGTSTVNGAAAFTSTVTTDMTKSVSTNPVGQIAWFAGTTAPTGWLVNDGSAVSRTTYSALFAYIGTLYGAGDGSTTFNLPNMQRRIPVGSGGTGSGTLANTVGATGGAETVALAGANMPSTVGVCSSTITNTGVAAGGATNVAGTGGTWSAGSGTAINNLQPSMVLLSCIRAY